MQQNDSLVRGLGKNDGGPSALDREKDTIELIVLGRLQPCRHPALEESPAEPVAEVVPPYRRERAVAEPARERGLRVAVGEAVILLTSPLHPYCNTC